ncbi:Cytochrome P450 monooxygenase [Penicillium alfredii]|uniref:Cytochrome P450 monooxygenase n=1 Tax=Penicillium alfredii TaxID=1506179 RepID=A0A9W9FRU3_9EURO|nr:Cytochrome P450 monooxygenase [Penicillium alfredii]KAJ5105249.1 Cytochrome P450 monooxygenase [Penicillium alfredii]
MNRVRSLIARPAVYEPLNDSTEDDADEMVHATRQQRSQFSQFEYNIFFLLGVAMLWAWNMFLAAAPYFHSRFQSDDWAAAHYQPSILSVSTVTNLATVSILAKRQQNASYPWRITLSLLINCFVFTLLAFSTVVLKDASVRVYFGFLMVMVFGTSLATGINQNGVFAYVSGFDREEYTQAIMGGQGVAGVLPCVVQILSVLAVPSKDQGDQKRSPSMPQGSSSGSAFIYFLTSTGFSVAALMAFLYLVQHRPHTRPKLTTEDDEIVSDSCAHDKTVGLWTLFTKLRFLALSVFLCFLVSMVFPVYTAEIQSVNDPAKSRIYDQTVFVPLAFLVWNVGDLVGRMAVAIPWLSLAHRPSMAFALAIARVVFIPLYQLCNINGRGAAVHSDFFYLFIVQLSFGATNGYLASSCMMGAGHWVSADEREAAGGFMSMALVGGLAAGSLLKSLAHFCLQLQGLVYLVGWVVYTLYFHPLKHYPGPKLAAISPLVHLLWDIQGKQHSIIKELHDKYGDVVRIAPNTLAYRAAPAWKDIYGHRKKGQRTFLKDPSLYSPTPNGVNAIITATEHNHSRMRRLLTHAFSNKALREQEGILHRYANLLIERLQDQLGASRSQVIDMTRWFNFTTFDLIGDLAFGEPFDCLINSTYHWWILIILDAVKASAYLKIFWFYQFLLPLVQVLVPRHLLQKRTDSFALSVDKVRRRLKRGTSRPDFTSYILKHSTDGKGMTPSEMDANAAVFVLAGSETTAALLSGCMYYLLRHREKYRRLVQEIRSAFEKDADIKLSSIAELPYLNAVLTETLRIYPPIPAMLPRLVPEGGAMINGQYVPGGVSVAISLYSTFRSATNFNDADAFLLWNFDLDMSPASLHWINQNSYSLWSRPELKVKLSRAGVEM